jgi:DNA-binding NtrC family response regulator
VVISDQRLADGDWRDLLSDLQKEREGLPLIVSSRLADDRLWAEVLNLGGYDLLMKPFSATEVARVVRMAAGGGPSLEIPLSTALP